MYRKLCKASLYFNSLFKYIQVAAWALWFLKTSLNQVWSDSAIVPTANLSGSDTEHLMAVETSRPKGAILDMWDTS